MKKITFLILACFIFSFKAFAQFSSIVALNPVPIISNTADKPQSKTWYHDGKHWTVLGTSTGIFLCRLNGNSWDKVLQLHTSGYGRADCKVTGGVVHVLIFKKEISRLVSAEYDPATQLYKRWQERPRTVDLQLDSGVETATIDIDTQGRMWLVSDGVGDINVRWSDFPYSIWSPPKTLATGITDDDIGEVIAMPASGKIGVFWSDQNSQRFGFRTHADGDDPTNWTVNEVPASQSALNIGHGMADDHMNIKAGADGTLYCAVKTSYDKVGYPKLALLVRRPAGNWDNLYNVSEFGTRGVVVVNEAAGKLKVAFTSLERGGDILYRESPIGAISFGPAHTLISGHYDNVTSMKQTYNHQISFLACDSVNAVGVVGYDDLPVVNGPTLISPVSGTAGLAIPVNFTWRSVPASIGYKLDISTVPDFSSLTFSQDNINDTTLSVTTLATNALYYWRVKVFTPDSMAVSASWSFSTTMPLPATPVLVSPADAVAGLSVPITFTWNPVAGAGIYTLQVSDMADFSKLLSSQSGLVTTSATVSNLSPNQIYYWRVSATNTAGNSSWSNVWSFNTNAVPEIPIQISPVNGFSKTTSNPTLTWQAAPGADFYHLEISKQADFSSLVFSTQAIMVNSVEVPFLDQKTTYYWRLKGGNAAGSSNWSTTWNFTVNLIPPKLSSPGDGSSKVSVSPVLSWKNSPGANSFGAQISDKPDFSAITVNLTNINGTKTQISGLKSGITYFWRVKSINETGSSIWSETYRFTTISAKRLTQVNLSETADENLQEENKCFAVLPDSKTLPERKSVSGAPSLVSENLSAYPNPFGNITTIRFNLPENTGYTLTLFDAKGTEIKVLQKGIATTMEEFRLNQTGLHLRNGLYLVKLQTAQTVKTLRLIYQK